MDGWNQKSVAVFAGINFCLINFCPTCVIKAMYSYSFTAQTKVNVGTVISEGKDLISVTSGVRQSNPRNLCKSFCSLSPLWYFNT